MTSFVSHGRGGRGEPGDGARIMRSSDKNGVFVWYVRIEMLRLSSQSMGAYHGFPRWHSESVEKTRTFGWKKGYGFGKLKVCVIMGSWNLWRKGNGGSRGLL